MRQACFGPSPTSIHVAAGSWSGQDKRRLSRTKGNSLRLVESCVRLQRRCSAEILRSVEKSVNLGARAESKWGIAGIQEGKSSQSRTCAVHRQYGGVMLPLFILALASEGM